MPVVRRKRKAAVKAKPKKAVVPKEPAVLTREKLLVKVGEICAVLDTVSKKDRGRVNDIIDHLYDTNNNY